MLVNHHTVRFHEITWIKNHFWVVFCIQRLAFLQPKLICDDSSLSTLPVPHMRLKNTHVVANSSTVHLREVLEIELADCVCCQEPQRQALRPLCHCLSF